MILDKNKIEAPTLKNYLSVTVYLQDLYTYRKNENSGFSYESWSSELGFKSRSFLKMIIDGQRTITVSSMEAICKSMSFSKAEAAYFSLLVHYGQARDQDEKAFYLDKIFEHQGQSREMIEVRHYNEFLSSKDLPKLLVLLSFKDIRKTAEGLSSFLRVSAEQVTLDLKKLEELNLASQDPISGEWQSTKKSFKVPKNLGCGALENYHNQSLVEAIAAQKLASNLRRFRSILLPLAEADFEKILLDIESLVTKSVAKYDSENLAQKRLYKMNINLYPITELFEAET